MKRIVASIAALAGCALVPAAHAAVTICQSPNCAPSDENVLLASASSVSTVSGTTNNSHVGVTFSSPVSELLNAQANGQARVEAADGILNGLTFLLDAGNTFGSAVFNLAPLSGNVSGKATNILLTYFLSGGGSGSQMLMIGTNGENNTGIFGTAGERFTGVSFVASNTAGIGDLRQLRIGDVRAPGGSLPPPAVPEPSTWLLMILGFATVGYVMRSGRENSVRVRFAA